MKKVFTLFILLGTMLAACHQKQPIKRESTEPIHTHKNLPGDSTLYGLACEGCTDSILVLLPFSGGDPDTFDIINAFQSRHIYGRPCIGDELGVILNPEDKAEALMVVNIERLRGKWCYQVMPHFRNLDQMPDRVQKRMLSRIPDSVRQSLMVPREYGFQLKRGNIAQSFGGMRQTTTDHMSPVEYPAIRRYKEWRLYNGRLILTTDSIRLPKGKKGAPETDTADIIQLQRDTLVLKFKDHEQSYYRKTDNNQ
ncbi:lipocalin family protein [Prevotella sp. tf2-5]|uniref:lipocalin family protein n=1 Tax=Prevotella sp. tf2-5 TaxID=1761889 RepID=UPI0008F386BA|nr:lipocalin family protein [Prevotella sp. tf2-5]SFO82485.1 hypothetical protein SAMN04487852_108118 [Prevotella sp. tf2-5]